ncbi:hypothetical protein Peur_004369 [Populus x canadensis]
MPVDSGMTSSPLLGEKNSLYLASLIFIETQFHRLKWCHYYIQETPAFQPGVLLESTPREYRLSYTSSLEK